MEIEPPFTQPMKHPEPLFFIQRDEGVVAGPYDVVQMAGLLRRKIISGETMTRRDGEDHWMAFAWQPQFALVRELPADAVSTRVVELDEAAAARAKGPVPLPSAETMLKLAGLAAGCLVAFAVAFALAWLDTTMAYILMGVGMAATAIAYCFIVARLLDEDYWTLALVWFVPGGDIYYFLSNIWEYFAWFCLKYIGLAILAGAAAGLAAHAGHG